MAVKKFSLEVVNDIGKKEAQNLNIKVAKFFAAYLRDAGKIFMIKSRKILLCLPSVLTPKQQLTGTKISAIPSCISYKKRSRKLASKFTQLFPYLRR